MAADAAALVNPRHSSWRTLEFLRIFSPCPLDPLLAELFVDMVSGFQNFSLAKKLAA